MARQTGSQRPGELEGRGRLLRFEASRRLQREMGPAPTKEDSPELRPEEESAGRQSVVDDVAWPMAPWGVDDLSRRGGAPVALHFSSRHPEGRPHPSGEFFQ